MIPSEPRIAKVMSDTGMDRLQAIRHLQQRDILTRQRTIGRYQPRRSS